MKLLLMIFVGQFVFAVLRTAAVRAIAADRRAAAISLNAGASLMRLLVLTGGVSAVLESDWRGLRAELIFSAPLEPPATPTVKPEPPLVLRCLG